MGMNQGERQRLPLQPLIDAAPRRTGNNLAEVLHMDPRQITRWADGIPIYSADRVAVRLGLHPAEVWGQAWWAAA